MKKILFVMICLLGTLSAQASRDNDRPIRVDQLPKSAQEFIHTHFSGVKIAIAKMEADFFDKEYGVIFTNGNKVNFLRDGRWKEIECKYSDFPINAIPGPIRKYIKENCPDTQIWKIERKERERGYEVNLSNRWELEFDKYGNLTDIDRD